MPDLRLAAASARLRGNPGRPRKADPVTTTLVVTPVAARLLDLPGAATYLGLKTRKFREIVASGAIPRVRIPLPHGGEVRKVLVDRHDLDKLIMSWKDRGA